MSWVKMITTCISRCDSCSFLSGCVVPLVGKYYFAFCVVKFVTDTLCSS
jgi:hypothetical protein